MILYGLKTCDTCRKAEKALVASGLAVTKVDVREDGVPEAKLRDFFSTFGEDLLNRRSTTWRNLSEADRQADPIALLAANPTLMKRPVIEADHGVFLGWGEQTQKALLGS